jgi:type II secretory pathway pseudopilin PulG
MRNERGFALAATVVALVLIAALAAAVSFAGVQEQRMATHQRAMRQAEGDAELALLRALDSGASLPRGVTGDGASGWRVHRLGERLYLVDVTGVDPGDQASQRLGLLVARNSCDSVSSAPEAAKGTAGPPSDAMSPITANNCQSDNNLGGFGRLEPLRSRAWIQLF